VHALLAPCWHTLTATTVARRDCRVVPYVLQPPILTSALQELGCLQAHRGLHGTHSRPVLACQTAPERLCNTCIGMPEPWWLLQATGSAPEVQTLPHLSQAKQDDCQAGSLEARRLKKDLQTLHTDPSTLGPTSYPQTAATAATIADSEQAAQWTTGVTSATELQLQAASPLVNPDQLVASTAAASADTAAAVTAVQGSAPADSMHADKPSAVTAVNDVVDVAEPEVGNDVAHAEGSEAVAADEDAVMPQALNVTQQDAEGSKVPDAPKDEAPPADAVLPLDTGVTDRQKEGDVHNRTEEEEQQVPGASDATCTETAVQQPVEDELQEEPQQSKIAASAKPKGKRKAAASLKGNAKRQKGKQDDREASPVPDKAAGKAAAPSQKEHADVAPVRAAAAAKPAASKAVAAQPVAAEAAATKQGGRTVKKGASSASGAGIKKAAAKPSDAATKKGGTATSGAKRKASAAALASDSDADDADNDKADHTADDAPDEAGQAVEAAVAEADEAVAAPPVPRDRRNKAKEANIPPATQPAQAVKKATKQQKLPFTKAAPSSPKPGKAAVTATAASVAAAASAGTGSKTSKGKASEKKSGASSEPASSAKEPKGKQVHNVCLLAGHQAKHPCCFPSWSGTEWCRHFLFVCSSCIPHAS